MIRTRKLSKINPHQMPRKNDSQATTTALLAQKIDNLAAQLTEGFRLVHEKQDYTNGKVTLAGNDIVALQKADIAIQAAADAKIAEIRADFKYQQFIWYCLTVSLSLVVGLISYIVYSK